MRASNRRRLNQIEADGEVRVYGRRKRAWEERPRG